MKTYDKIPDNYKLVTGGGKVKEGDILHHRAGSFSEEAYGCICYPISSEGTCAEGLYKVYRAETTKTPPLPEKYKNYTILTDTSEPVRKGDLTAMGDDGGWVVDALGLFEAIGAHVGQACPCGCGQFLSVARKQASLGNDVPEGYSLLTNPDEILKEGDKYFYKIKWGWEPVVLSIGKKRSRLKYAEVARPTPVAARIEVPDGFELLPEGTVLKRGDFYKSFATAPWYEVFGLAGYLTDSSRYGCRRIKVEPKYREYTIDEVPVGALVRQKSSAGTPQRHLITGVSKTGGVLTANQVYPYFEKSPAYLLEYDEVSLDSGKTWAPCGVKIA